MSGYRLIDSGYFKKYEQIGAYRVIRPSAQAVWRSRQDPTLWEADAEFTRGSFGDGKWEFKNKIPASWTIQINNLSVLIRLTDFGHIGIFPEHHSWSALDSAIERQLQKNMPFRLLNLFAYTGTVTLGASLAGAQVVHVDASKTSVAWARENAEASSLSANPIRWIVDDVQKFVQREIKRGSKYQGIVLDPPSYGRGVKGEIWKIEEHLMPLMDDLSELFDEDFAFLQLSAHSQGYTPIAMENILGSYLEGRGGIFSSMEMTVKDDSSRLLPSGACARWVL
jgi:23S rRNA (cytosine1962-C5)-methyltransferase